MSENLSVVVFSYNRPGYLDRTLASFIEQCSYPRDRMQILVADDGSDEKYDDAMKEIVDKHGVEFVWAPHQGMGNNFNNGIRAARGDYVLHLQDDWELEVDNDFVNRSIEILETDPAVAMVRLSELRSFAGSRKPRVYGSVIAQNLEGDFYLYSDNPHIKRRNFHHEFGWYRPNASPHDTEVDMCRRFNAQNHFHVVWLGEYFRHFGNVSLAGNQWPELPELSPEYEVSQ